MRTTQCSPGRSNPGRSQANLWRASLWGNASAHGSEGEILYLTTFQFHCGSGLRQEASRLPPQARLNTLQMPAFYTHIGYWTALRAAAGPGGGGGWTVAHMVV